MIIFDIVIDTEIVKSKEGIRARIIWFVLEKQRFELAEEGLRCCWVLFSQAEVVVYVKPLCLPLLWFTVGEIRSHAYSLF